MINYQECLQNDIICLKEIAFYMRVKLLYCAAAHNGWMRCVHSPRAGKGGEAK